jgi:hypothetical protein
MKFSSQKDINKLVRELVREGWSFKRGGKHGRLTHLASKKILTVPCSPSDRYAARNFSNDVYRLIQKVIPA